MNEPGRKTLPHFPSVELHNQSVIQYVTCNISKRRPLLARSQIHQLLLNKWRDAHHWLVGRYVIMPDHLHFFCAPGLCPIAPLKRWMEFWRSRVTKAWPDPNEVPIWQKDFFDRQLRNGESYSEKWHYILENPVRAGLVRRSEEWPYQGELNVLPWHERV